jgi:hypothetical protein
VSLRRTSLATAVIAAVLLLAVGVGADASGKPRQVLITLRVQGEGLLHSSDVACASCRRSVAVGSVVTVTAAPADHYAFDSWSGECVGKAPVCVLAADGNRLVSARFERKQDIVSVTVSGPGVVTSVPPGISCDGRRPDTASCSAPFDEGSIVRLTPAPGAGATFDQWGLDCDKSGSGGCLLAVAAGAEAAGDFEVPGPPPSQAPRLHVASRLAAALAVRSSSTSLNMTCRACTTQLDVTRTQTVSARAPSGAKVTWTGGCVGAASACIVPGGLSGAVYVTSAVNFGLSVSASSGGSVTSTPPGIDCRSNGGTCSSTFPTKNVVLHAVPARGSRFVGWAGDCRPLVRNPCQLPLPTPFGAAAAFSHRR